MPYLKERDRARFVEGIDEIAAAFHEHTSAGELNYVLTNIAQAFVLRRGVSYETLNAAVGALEAAKLEFYRRAVAPYEDKKIAENGDVY